MGPEGHAESKEGMRGEVRQAYVQAEIGMRYHKRT